MARNPIQGVALALFFTLAFVLLGHEAPCKPAPLRIGVLISYDQTLPWAQSFIRGLGKAQALSGRQIEFFIEYVDVRRFSSFFQGEAFSNYLREKYRDTRLDAAIVESLIAARFINKHGKTIFGDIPYVAVAANMQMTGLEAVRHSVLSHSPRVEETVALALRQRPGAKRITIIGDGGLTSQNYVGLITARVAALRPGLPIEVLDGLTVDELAARIPQLPRDSIVFYTVMLKDRMGTPLVSRDVAARLAALSPAPFYGFHEQLMGTGIIGGYLLSGEKVALAAVAEALKLLQPTTRPPMGQELYTLAFDKRALDKWAIPASSLPRDAAIQFDEASFWARYRFRIIAVASLVLAETALLVYLFRLYRQRKHLTAALTQSNVILERRVEERTADLDAANQELKRQNEILLENQALREEMEHISRHDIRSPLSGIINFCDYMQTIPDLPEELFPVAGMIKDSCYSIIDMANRSLDLRKIEMGTYELRIEDTDLLALLRQIGHDTNSLRETDSLLHLTLGDRQATATDTFLVPADRSLCYSMLSNLVRNALEAAPPDSETSVVTVDLSTTAAEAIIRIHNRQAIPVAIRQRFLEKYATFAKANGTGLGAYSARLAAEAHGGKIAWETSEADGTVVTVHLPLSR